MAFTGSSVSQLLSGTNGPSETGLAWRPQDQGQQLFCQVVPVTMLAAATVLCSLTAFFMVLACTTKSRRGATTAEKSFLRDLMFYHQGAFSAESLSQPGLPA